VGRQSGDDNLADWHAVAAANRNGILVLEDINEHPFRVERMLLQLLNSGILANQRAIVLGSFTGARLTITTRAMIYRRSVTIFAAARCSAHQRPGLRPRAATVTLPLGAEALLVNNAATTTLTLSGHPVLTE
jgi:muramoyltetrapeptide carboxypeptidase